jgi:hypothetical protein
MKPLPATAGSGFGFQVGNLGIRVDIPAWIRQAEVPSNDATNEGMHGRVSARVGAG